MEIQIGDMKSFVDYVRRAYASRDTTEVIDVDVFDEDVFCKLKSDGIMFSKTIPRFGDAEHIPGFGDACSAFRVERIKIGNPQNDGRWISKKISQPSGIEWLSPEGINFARNSEPLYRRNLPINIKKFRALDDVKLISIILTQFRKSKPENTVNYMVYGVDDFHIGSIAPLVHCVCVMDKSDVPTNLSVYRNKISLREGDVASNLKEIKFNAASVYGKSSASTFKIIRSLFECMETGGYIFIRDTYPSEAWLLERNYCGDCYKLPQMLKNSLGDRAEILTLPINTGFTIMRKIDGLYEPENCRVTVVTALYNIRRGAWIKYQRKWSDYLHNMEVFLPLEVNMVVFVEEEDVEFIKKCRNSQSHKTIVKALPFEQLRNYKFLDRIKEIHADERYCSAQKDPGCPEVREPLYNVITTSKLDLIKQVADDNPFNSDLFVWMDAGYGHGTKQWPDGVPWVPHKLLTSESLAENRIAQIRLCGMESVVDNNWDFYKQHIDVIIGGFFAGTAKAIRQYHDIYYELFEKILDEDIVDDDQYYATLCAVRHPELFNPCQGGWYDGFRLFN